MPVLLGTCPARRARLARSQVKTDHYGFFLTSERGAFNIPPEVSFVVLGRTVVHVSLEVAAQWLDVQVGVTISLKLGVVCIECYPPAFLNVCRSTLFLPLYRL